MKVLGAHIDLYHGLWGKRGRHFDAYRVEPGYYRLEMNSWTLEIELPENLVRRVRHLLAVSLLAASASAGPALQASADTPVDLFNLFFNMETK